MWGTIEGKKIKEIKESFCLGEACLIFEYDKEEEERKLRKAEYEAGVESGIAEGKRLAQKEGTIALSRLGLPVEQIAMALQVDVELAKQWIGDK